MMPTNLQPNFDENRRSKANPVGESAGHFTLERGRVLAEVRQTQAGTADRLPAAQRLRGAPHGGHHGEHRPPPRQAAGARRPARDQVLQGRRVAVEHDLGRRKPQSRLVVPNVVC